MTRPERIHRKFMEIVDALVKKRINEREIQAVVLGGSVARGEETKHSDIDINFYVKEADLPETVRGFYKFKGKYIEEHYSSIENLKNENLLPEEKIIYDKTGKIKIPGFDEMKARNKFRSDLSESKRLCEIAENFFRKKDYQNCLYTLIGNGPSFILMHSLPRRFNLPFPSFRLMSSIKEVDKINKTVFYHIFEQIYHFNNMDKKKILSEFKKSYLFMSDLKKRENSEVKNLGFFEKSKVKYNLYGLKMTFNDYPFVFAHRFIVGCLAMWASDKNLDDAIRKILSDSLLKVLGLESIEKNLVEQKLNLSKKLIRECKKLK